MRRIGLFVAMGAGAFWAACSDPAFVILPPTDAGRDASVLDAPAEVGDDATPVDDAGDAADEPAPIDLEDFHVPGTQIFTDAQQKILAEHGGWSPLSGDMTGLPTTIFETVIGLTAEAAKKTGLPAGPTTHMSLADVVVKDNRIPPRGFSNAAYEAVGAGAVPPIYADGQNWADVPFPIPAGATHVKVRLVYQTVTREYVEALVNGNKTDNRGKDLESLWLQTDRDPPIAMAITELDL